MLTLPVAVKAEPAPPRVTTIVSRSAISRPIRNAETVSSSPQIQNAVVPSRVISTTFGAPGGVDPAANNKLLELMNFPHLGRAMKPGGSTRATAEALYALVKYLEQEGALGGLIFWFLGVHAPVLWAVLMAVLSLLPAVGTALVWLPVAAYLLVTGAVWQGLVLIGYGVLVIGLLDNILRPILVGKDTKMPDYVVLIATLGGMAIFGLNGFVIGPVIAAMFMAVWDLFSASRSQIEIDRSSP